MPLVQTLFDLEKIDREKIAEPFLTPALREMYDGDLHFPAAPPDAASFSRVHKVADRPYVIANFVTTLDGTASFKIPGASSGSNISASNAADRFIMGLLRSSVDAIMVGANTIHDTGPAGLWIPHETYPDARDVFRDYRENVLILTTAAGEQELTRRGAARLPSIEVKILTATGPIAPAAILDLLGSQFGVRRLLHEGGPTLFGEFLAANAVDEFFLTLSPQIAGRLPHTIRPGIVEGVEFLPATAPWFDLLTVKQSGPYLYLRYRRKP